MMAGAPYTLLKGGVYIHPTLAEGFWSLMEDVKPQLEQAGVQIWTNQNVPPNDGGISLGQAALAARSVADFGM